MYQGIDGRIILKCLLRKERPRMSIIFSWLSISVQWRVLFNSVMNLWSPYKAGNIFDQLSSCQILRITLLHEVTYLY
jgi:hypothetical protein